MTEEAAPGPHDALMLRTVDQTLALTLKNGKPPNVDIESFPDALKAEAATFVTLEKNGQLRGCIGSLQAHRPLILDLVANTYRAGFKDPRFKPLTAQELPDVAASISLLSTPEPMPFADEADLLSQLRPGIDGLILEDAGRRGTFLPQVWDQLPTAEAFFTRLKGKAGLPANHWSDTVKVQRYTVEKIGPKSNA